MQPNGLESLDLGSLGLGFPDTHREIRALTATGMDEARAEAIIYTVIRVSAATEAYLRAHPVRHPVAPAPLRKDRLPGWVILAAAEILIAVVLNAC